MATRLPVGWAGRALQLGRLACAQSATKRSRWPIATGLPFLPRRQTPSHWISCGQTRPGDARQRVVVEERLGGAGQVTLAQQPMKRGMLTRTGQPSMQYGFLHSRQRSASALPAAASSRGSPRGSWPPGRSCSGMCPVGIRRRSSTCARPGRQLGGRLIEPVRLIQVTSPGLPGTPSVEGLLLEVAVCRQPVHQHAEVDLVPVELRPVDADELGLAADADAAAATHAGAVHHDRVGETIVRTPKGR